MIDSQQRTDLNQALAKAIAYMNAGKPELAKPWVQALKMGIEFHFGSLFRG